MAGESLIFDDTHEHSAWNESDQVRVVLFVDFLRELPWPISWLNRGMIALLRVSPFVQNIVTGLDAFEREIAERDCPRPGSSAERVRSPPPATPR